MSNARSLGKGRTIASKKVAFVEEYFLFSSIVTHYEQRVGEAERVDRRESKMVACRTNNAVWLQVARRDKVAMYLIKCILLQRLN